MLIRYKKTFEKIAMGLLSFMPNEKDLKKLQQSMKNYEMEESWQLFLWKSEDDIIGLIGITFQNSDSYEIQHISVNPSHRNQGIGKKMVQAMKEIYPAKMMLTNHLTEGFINKCGDENGKDSDAN
jgi:riboflavin biosynthesis RibT protein